MTKGTFYFIVFCFFIASCNAQETAQNTSNVSLKEDLKNYLLTQYDDIKISEVYAKYGDKKDYLKKSLGDSLTKEVVGIKSHDIYFKELSANTETYLGVAYLTYKSQEKAKKAISGIEPTGFFDGTKILTKYTAINTGSTNLIVYTESAADKISLDYLNSLPKKIKDKTISSTSL